MSFKEISPAELREDHFDFWKKGLLLTAEAEGVTNTMTIGWGGIGVMWGKNVVFVVVRPERYTHGLMEKAERFSVCAFTDEYKKELTLCGTVSGKDRNKFEECAFTLKRDCDTPYIGEAKIALLCKKLSATPFFPEQISSEVDKWYGSHGGYHTIYIGEIEKILEK